jgi:restriction endonuclease S subunit
MIPLPPLAEQEKIVTEIEPYQKVFDNARSAPSNRDIMEYIVATAG